MPQIDVNHIAEKRRITSYFVFIDTRPKILDSFLTVTLFWGEHDRPSVIYSHHRIDCILRA